MQGKSAYNSATETEGGCYLLPSPDAAETLYALADALTLAIRRGDRIECRTIYRKVVSEGNGGLELLRQRPPTKTERCKVWLIELLATVPREAKLVYREGKALGFNERLIRRAMQRAGAVCVRAGRRKTHKGMIYLAKELREMLSGVEVVSGVESDAPPPTTTKPFTCGRFAAMSRRAEKGQSICNPADHDLAPNEGFTPIYSADNTNNKAKPGPVVPEEDGRDVVEWKGQKDRKHWRRK